MELLIAQVPHFVSGVFVQNTVVTEVSLQLQMAPVE
jgi:hypothetical protein